jgi:hypothetical protein
VLQETTVHGGRALWVRGPHVLQVQPSPANGQSSMDMRRLVAGNVLVWEEAGITYRLETTQPLPEALRSAESLVPLPPGPTATLPPHPPTPLTLPPIGGETTLADAGQRFSYSVLLPTYPADLGPPDHVYVQDLGSPAVILVWRDPAHPAQARLSLYYLPPGVTGSKTVETDGTTVLQQTAVNGQTAYWVQGPHMLRFYDPQTHPEWQQGRLIDGHVLIWTRAALTYRLETTLPLAEAVRIAESLR